MTRARRSPEASPPAAITMWACHPYPRVHDHHVQHRHTCAQAGCHAPRERLPEMHGGASADHALPSPAPACLAAASVTPAPASAPCTAPPRPRRSRARAPAVLSATRICRSLPTTTTCSDCHVGGSGQLPRRHHGRIHTVAASASLECAGCHLLDRREDHPRWTRTEGACAVCHENPTKGNLTRDKTSAECAGCHASEGTDYHAEQAARHTATYQHDLFRRRLS